MQNKDLPSLASGSLEEQPPSPEMHLHLSEDEEDVADEPANSNPDLNQSSKLWIFKTRRYGCHYRYRTLLNINASIASYSM